MCKICTRPFAFSFAFVRVRKPVAVSYSTIAHAKFRAASPSYPSYRASALFNHVVGDREQRRGHVEAEGSCGLEVDAPDLVGNCTGRLPGFSPLRMRSI